MCFFVSLRNSWSMDEVRKKLYDSGDFPNDDKPFMCFLLNQKRPSYKLGKLLDGFLNLVVLQPEHSQYLHLAQLTKSVFQRCSRGSTVAIYKWEYSKNTSSITLYLSMNIIKLLHSSISACENLSSALTSM